MEYNSQLNGMVKDVEKVVNEHMKKILSDYDEKAKQMENLWSIINELPFVKKIIKEKENLKKRVNEFENNMYEEEGIKLKIKDKKYLKDAMLITIAGIAAAMKNVG